MNESTNIKTGFNATNVTSVDQIVDVSNLNLPIDIQSRVKPLADSTRTFFNQLTPYFGETEKPLVLGHIQAIWNVALQSVAGMHLKKSA